MNFFQIWHYFWGACGCFLNLLLVYIAIFKSPKAIRTYATLIVNFAITDFLECFFDVFIQIRLLPAPGDVTMTYIFNGFCQYFGDMSCKIGASLFLHCIPHSVWSLLLSFSYRYYILHHPGLTRRTLIYILIVIYIPSLVQGLTYWTNFVETDEILPLATKIFPSYNFSEETGVISGIVDVTTVTATYAIVHLSFPIFPVYTIIYFLRRKIIAHLLKNSQMMTAETKAVHTQMLRALTFQAFIPIFVWIGASCYLISQLGIIQESPLMEHAVFVSVILMPTLSPFTYLLFVRPYKTFCTKIIYTLTCSKKRPDDGKGSKFDSHNTPSHTAATSRVAPISNS